MFLALEVVLGLKKAVEGGPSGMGRPKTPKINEAMRIQEEGLETYRKEFFDPRQLWPASFGPGSAAFPSSTTGDSVFLEDFGLDIDVPQGYVSGTALSSSATFDNATLASLGVTPGTTHGPGTLARTASCSMSRRRPRPSQAPSR